MPPRSNSQTDSRGRHDVQRRRPMTSPTIAILLATYRRERLLFQTLRSLNELRSGHAFEVIVVDNDAAGHSARAVNEHRGEFDFPVRGVCEPRPGIAAARNRGLDESKDYDIVCFIDDDEVVDSEWLDEIIRPVLNAQADAVSGPVRSDYEVRIPRWAELGDFFSSPRIADGTRVKEAATNNLAISRSALDASTAPRFDDRFSESGGSDIFLSSQFTSAGNVIVWASEAWVSETVPSSRCTAQWIRTRAIRGGNTHGRVALLRPDRGAGRPGSSIRRLSIVFAGALRIAGGTLGMVTGLNPNRSRRAARGYRTMLRGIGYLRAVVGNDVLEYKR